MKKIISVWGVWRDNSDGNILHAGSNYSHRGIIPLRCNEILFMYSQKKNCAASVLISIFLCMWAIYLIPRPIFSCSRIGRPIVGTYNSLTDTWKWKLGLSRAIPFLGIFVSNFRYCVVAVMQRNNFPFSVLKSCNRRKANPPLLVLNYQHILPSSLLLQPEA